MKKIILLAILLLATATFAQRIGKGEKQLNAGIELNSGDGLPIYVGLDYGVHPDITVGGQIDYHYSSNSITVYDKKITTKSTAIILSANGNYHFNRILEIPNNWDFYAGLGLHYIMGSTRTGNQTTSYSDGPNPLSQVGGRYFFSDNLAINAEFRYVNAGGGTKLGVTYIF